MYRTYGTPVSSSRDGVRLTTVAIVSPEAAAADGVEPSSIDKIRTAALRSFAACGTSATTLRGVAAAAGVSLGLVQHHFATKAGLIEAVDRYVLDVVITPMAQPVSDLAPDSVSEVGHRVQRIISDHPDIAAYLGRALVDGSQLGATIFDTLYEVGTLRWQTRLERGETRPDIDLQWAVINSMILALGTISMRGHIERHMSGAFTSSEQLHRWQESVNGLLRDGLFRRGDSPEAAG
ncbi:TetR/AcrR family transcriptional regulator [Mycolicibacterium diernhoferi]|uniref:TetR/AcrR family transcriptional regulator n=1 Tax=Mycolicibacterium diernhoferi TaxID=1801 RepID=A0A2A7NV60_9MYCO|nr:TetR/AcrR family transcriptional regulator [Mycolicibacterium diernhoferi]QYL20478.1 TetR/AcrR family transcriptional regulator [Mycolicibacterium diernhoferi]